MSGEPANTPNFTVCVNICPTAASPCGFCSEAATVCSQARAAVTTCPPGGAPAHHCARAPEARLDGQTHQSRTAHCAAAGAALSALRRCAASPAAAPCHFRRRLKLACLPALRHSVALRLGVEGDGRAASLASVETQTAAFLCVQNSKDHLKFGPPAWSPGLCTAQVVRLASDSNGGFFFFLWRWSQTAVAR